MPLRQRRAPVELLSAGRDVEGGVPLEEVDGLEGHPDGLAGHDGEVLGAGDVLEAELEPEDNVRVDDVVAAVGPRAHARAAARLVGVLAAGVELAVAVARDVEVVVRELGAAVVERGRVGDELLEAGQVELVADGLAVDGVPGRGVEDLEGAGRVEVCVEAGGGFDGRLGDGVAVAVRVEVGEGHGVAFVVDEAVGVPVDGRVHAQGEDVLVVDGQDARVDDGAPGDLDAVVDGLGADDAGRSDLVRQLTRLVEHEGHDVFVVGDGDDGLDDEFSAADDGCFAGAVVGVLPADAGVLLVDTDYVLHGHWLPLVARYDSAQVVDRAQAVAAQFQVVRHGARTGVAEIKGRFLVERCPGVTVGDVHIGECQAVEETAAIISHLQH